LTFGGFECGVGVPLAEPRFRVVFDLDIYKLKMATVAALPGRSALDK
jgi:hypothetical protein